jgi:hypothetical protein
MADEDEDKDEDGLGGADGHGVATDARSCDGMATGGSGQGGFGAFRVTNKEKHESFASAVFSRAATGRRGCGDTLTAKGGFVETCVILRVFIVPPCGFECVIG